MSSEEVCGVVEDLWRVILGVEYFDETQTILDLGGTSISAEMIAARVREAFEVELLGTEILRCGTLENVVSVIVSRLETGPPGRLKGV